MIEKINKQMPNIYTLLKLSKYKLSIAVTISAIAGFVIYNKNSVQIIYLIIGIFFLSACASVINQIQELEFDKLMSRTKQRPLPTGKISIKNSIIFASIIFLIGSFYLYKLGIIPLLLGWLNIVIYNLIYTKLKTITYLSIIPGAVVGAIPPLIGWVGAGGHILAPKILSLTIFMFLWQIPHFWLLALKYKEEYKAAGFATVNMVFNDSQVKKIIFMWTLSTTAISYLFVYYSLIPHNIPIFILFTSINCGLIILFYKLMSSKNHIKPIKVFIISNIFLVAILSIIIVSSVTK